MVVRRVKQGDARSEPGQFVSQAESGDAASDDQRVRRLTAQAGAEKPFRVGSRVAVRRVTVARRRCTICASPCSK